MSSLTPRTVDGGFTVIDSVRLSNKTEIVLWNQLRNMGVLRRRQLLLGTL